MACPLWVYECHTCAEMRITWIVALFSKSMPAPIIRPSSEQLFWALMCTADAILSRIHTIQHD